MESQLDRSLRLLDEAIPKNKNKLIRPHRATPTKNFADIDSSMTLNLQEARLLMENSGFLPDVNETLNNSARMSTVSNISSMSFVKNRVERRTEQLYERFLEVLQVHTNDTEIFETISELTQAVIDTIEDVKQCGKREMAKAGTEDWLMHEKNTWQLLFALYKDRLITQKDDGMDVDAVIPLGNSEKAVVSNLYTTNAKLREYQLIVDWLEEIKSEEGAHVGHFSDRTVGWENTLHQLQSAGMTVFGSNKEIVKHLDPDAPFREKRPLHDLDMQDESRLTKQIFVELRRGRIEEAQSLCEHYGQPWRAAILEGWRLHHDPNYEPQDASGLKQPIEGNPRRDLWKRCAWQMADNVQIDDYSRAIAGLLCGHLGSLLNIAKENWADLLWSYLRTQIDIRVESEVRDCCVKSYLKMPDGYWTNKMSLEQIFAELNAHKSPIVRAAAQRPVNIIQQYLILDDIPELMKHIDSWISDSTISTQMLRFLTHIVLFFRQIGKPHPEEIADRVIKAYVEALIKLGNAQLIAYYTAALPTETQLELYSSFMETLTNSEDRRVCFSEAISHGLDVQRIAFYTVDKIRDYKNSGENEILNERQQIKSLDDTKIQALEWLTFNADQISDLLWQANALIRNFMAQNKIECIRKTFKMVPSDAIKQLIKFYGSQDHLPHREDCAIKEFFCHQAYLTAIDSYNFWSDCFYKQKPKPPTQNAKPVGFTEKVAMEHQEQTFRADMEKWQQKVRDQTKRCRDFLYNILLFPDRGWLLEDPVPEEIAVKEPGIWELRETQMQNLRKIVIPEVIMLLYKILSLAGNHQDCIKLADDIANEERMLYKVYSKQKLSEFLMKIAETSLTLMNEQKDPWGYDQN
ncbi:nuclear pore complex protein Nup107 [Culicoides brevitarsis]|uniref:nuclear pore complex protein Nup107 n=1 Tax=Culicoides brevitarsis TaxID=469753 RepID=UPI00307CA953